MNVDFDVVFFGNSITKGSSFHECFPNISICNLGFPGDNLDGMLLRVNQIKAVNPQKVFVMAGINGLDFQTLQVFENKYEQLIKAIKNAIPSATIYLQSILPVNNNIAGKRICSNDKIIDANKLIADIAQNNGCIYINIHQLYLKDGEMNPRFTKDGLHLLQEGYDEWASLLKPYME